jgi:hypothetical protein
MRSSRPLVLLLALAAACTAFGKSEDAGPVDAGAPDRALAEDASVEDTGVEREGGQGPFCGSPVPGERLCDDFEGARALPRAWSRQQEANATIELTNGDEANPSRVLAIRLTGKNDVERQQGYLRLDHPPRGPSWRYRLEFKANVLNPSRNIAGPRVVSKVQGVDAGTSGTDDRLDVYVQFTSGQVSLAYLTPACDQLSGACTNNRESSAHSITPGWHAYELELVAKKAENTPAPPYGTVRLVVDGKGAIDEPLGIPLFDLKELATAFGVSYAAPSVAGTLLLDDVRIELVEP